MKKFFSLIVLFVVAVSCKVSEDTIRVSLNDDWEFSLDGSPVRHVNLPHDWAFRNGYSEDGAQGERGGYTCGGFGTYSNIFKLKASEIRNKTIYIDFDAVYMNSTVRINGKDVGFRPYGYISFSYDITSFVHPGKNRVELLVDNSREPSARWYHGCGIFGNVIIRSENSTHFVKDGIFIHSQNCGGNVTVECEVEGESGSICGYVTADGMTKPLTGVTDNGILHFDILDCRYWSPDDPFLYDLHLELYDKSGKICDEEDVRFGIKDIVFSPEKGIILNGHSYKVHGVCDHLEAGPVGAEWTKDLMRWRLGLLKEMGCNSVRTAHNPQLPFFYDLCDELGLLVLDEAFDGWMRKADRDYGAQAFSEWWERDLSAMIRRDRNHPCVYMYSVGNETKGDIAPKLVETCHRNDPTRPVTSGHSGSEYMDVFGVNGHSEKKTFLSSYVPSDKMFIGTENPHTWQVRGYYRTKTWYRDGYPNKGQDPFFIPDLTDEELFHYDWTDWKGRLNKKQIFNSSYDNATVRLTARHMIALQRDNDWLPAYYRWSGFDYLGEAGYVHGGWPFRAFMGGALDLAGFPKDLFYLYQSEWNKNVDMAHILPHWTHPDLEEGTIVPVWVYTTGDEVELFLNGKSVGRVRKGTDWDKIQCSFDVPWTPGELEAVAYRCGKEIARDIQRTAGEPCDYTVGIQTAGKTTILTFSQVDSNGVFCPYADSRVYVALPEGAFARSFENGNPVDDETNSGASSRRLFFGLSRLFVDGVTGEIPSAMIICDRSLKTSDKAYIAVHGLTDAVVRYTVDGSDPGLDSPQYAGSFTVTKDMIIKAKVFCAGKQIISMEEKIEGGLHWGKPGEKLYSDKRYTFDSDGKISWYQENDGAKRDAALRISYLCKCDSKLEIWNNSRKETEMLLPATSNSPVRKTATITLEAGANDIEIRLVSDSKLEVTRIEVL